MSTKRGETLLVVNIKSVDKRAETRFREPWGRELGEPSICRKKRGGDNVRIGANLTHRYQQENQGAALLRTTWLVNKGGEKTPDPNEKKKQLNAGEKERKKEDTDVSGVVRPGGKGGGRSSNLKKRKRT